VYADNWLLPFGKDLINWTEAAVIIPEAETLDTVNILSKISVEQRCRMRQKVYEMYRKYMETGRRVIRGIIENFELSHAVDVNRSTSMEVSKVQDPAPEFAILFNESTLSLINDQTVKWDSQLDRLWLESFGTRSSRHVGTNQLRMEPSQPKLRYKSIPWYSLSGTL
jgi:hypothetical protein